MRLFRRLLATAAVAAFALTIPTSVNAAEPTPMAAETYKNVATGKCLDHSNSNGLRVIRCNGLKWQKWLPHRWADGTVELKNYATSKCLSDYGGNPHAAGCNESRAQSWWVQRPGGGRLIFKNQQTGKCLDHSNTYDLRTIACTGVKWQQWV